MLTPEHSAHSCTDEVPRHRPDRAVGDGREEGVFGPVGGGALCPDFAGTGKKDEGGEEETLVVCCVGEVLLCVEGGHDGRGM